MQVASKKPLNDGHTLPGDDTIARDFNIAGGDCAELFASKKAIIIEESTNEETLDGEELNNCVEASTIRETTTRDVTISKEVPVLEIHSGQLVESAKEVTVKKETSADREMITEYKTTFNKAFHADHEINVHCEEPTPVAENADGIESVISEKFSIIEESDTKAKLVSNKYSTSLNEPGNSEDTFSSKSICVSESVIKESDLIVDPVVSRQMLAVSRDPAVEKLSVHEETAAEKPSVNNESNLEKINLGFKPVDSKLPMVSEEVVTEISSFNKGPANDKSTSHEELTYHKKRFLSRGGVTSEHYACHDPFSKEKSIDFTEPISCEKSPCSKEPTAYEETKTNNEPIAIDEPTTHKEYSPNVESTSHYDFIKKEASKPDLTLCESQKHNVEVKYNVNASILPENLTCSEGLFAYVNHDTSGKQITIQPTFSKEPTTFQELKRLTSEAPTVSGKDMSLEEPITSKRSSSNQVLAANEGKGSQKTRITSDQGGSSYQKKESECFFTNKKDEIFLKLQQATDKEGNDFQKENYVSAAAGDNILHDEKHISSLESAKASISESHEEYPSNALQEDYTMSYLKVEQSNIDLDKSKDILVEKSKDAPSKKRDLNLSENEDKIALIKMESVLNPHKQSDNNLFPSNEDLTKFREDTFQSSEAVSEIGETKRVLLGVDVKLLSENKKEVSENKEDGSENKKEVSENKEEVSENKNEVPENNEKVSENNEVASENNEKVCENKEEVSENKEEVSENKEEVSENKKEVFENKKEVFENKKEVSENKEVVSENKEEVSENKEEVSENKEEVSENKEEVFENKEEVCENNEEVSENNEVVSENNEVVSENNEVVSVNNEVVSENNEVVSVNNEVVSVNNEVVSVNKEEVFENKEEVCENKREVILLQENEPPLTDIELKKSTAILDSKEEAEVKDCKKEAAIEVKDCKKELAMTDCNDEIEVRKNILLGNKEQTDFNFDENVSQPVVKCEAVENKVDLDLNALAFDLKDITLPPEKKNSLLYKNKNEKLHKNLNALYKRNKNIFVNLENIKLPDQCALTKTKEGNIFMDEKSPTEKVESERALTEKDKFNLSLGISSETFGVPEGVGVSSQDEGVKVNFNCPKTESLPCEGVENNKYAKEKLESKDMSGRERNISLKLKKISFLLKERSNEQEEEKIKFLPRLKSSSSSSSSFSLFRNEMTTSSLLGKDSSSLTNIGIKDSSKIKDKKEGFPSGQFENKVIDVQSKGILNHSNDEKEIVGKIGDQILLNQKIGENKNIMHQSSCDKTSIYDCSESPKSVLPSVNDEESTMEVTGVDTAHKLNVDKKKYAEKGLKETESSTLVTRSNFDISDNIKGGSSGHNSQLLFPGPELNTTKDHINKVTEILKLQNEETDYSEKHDVDKSQTQNFIIDLSSIPLPPLPTQSGNDHKDRESTLSVCKALSCGSIQGYLDDESVSSKMARRKKMDSDTTTPKKEDSNGDVKEDDASLLKVGVSTRLRSRSRSVETDVVASVEERKKMMKVRRRSSRNSKEREDEVLNDDVANLESASEHSEKNGANEVKKLECIREVNESPLKEDIKISNPLISCIELPAEAPKPVSDVKVQDDGVDKEEKSVEKVTLPHISDVPQSKTDGASSEATKSSQPSVDSRDRKSRASSAKRRRSSKSSSSSKSRSPYRRRGRSRSKSRSSSSSSRSSSRRRSSRKLSRRSSSRRSPISSSRKKSPVSHRPFKRESSSRSSRRSSLRRSDEKRRSKSAEKRVSKDSALKKRDKDSSKDSYKEKESARESYKEKESFKDSQKEKDPLKDMHKEKDSSKDSHKEKELTKDSHKEKELGRDSHREQEYPKDSEKNSAKDSGKEKEKESSKDLDKNKEPQKEKDSIKDSHKERELAKDSQKGKETPKIASKGKEQLEEKEKEARKDFSKEKVEKCGQRDVSKSDEASKGNAAGKEIEKEKRGTKDKGEKEKIETKDKREKEKLNIKDENEKERVGTKDKSESEKLKATERIEKEKTGLHKILLNEKEDETTKSSSETDKTRRTCQDDDSLEKMQLDSVENDIKLTSEKSEEVKDSAEAKGGIDASFKSARKVSLVRSKSGEDEKEKPKKRKWGASATAKPTLEISSNSLKNLMPDVKPLSPSELTLKFDSEEDSSLEDNDEKEILNNAAEEAKEESEELGGTKSDYVHHHKKERKDVEEEGEITEEDDHPDISPVKRKRSSSKEAKRKEKHEKKEKKREGKDERYVVRESSPHYHRKRTISNQERNDRPQNVRKIRIVEAGPVNSVKLTVPPARNPVSKVVLLQNLVRPFTIKQLKDLLQRTGRLIENHFWIDAIKSKCLAMYENEDQAQETRVALHGVKWPTINPKNLHVDFATEEELKKKMGDSVHLEPPIQVEEPKRERRKIDGPVREWDLAKLGERSPGEREREKERMRREREEERIREREKVMRTLSPKQEKVQKKPAPVKSLDDLFRKTKAQPSIYWLPLTLSQIAEKEALRRKRMAETERRYAEMKAEEEKQRLEREKERQKRKEKEKEREKERNSRRSRSRSRRRTRSRSQRRSPRRSPRRSRRSGSRDSRKSHRRTKSHSRSSSRSRS